MKKIAILISLIFAAGAIAAGPGYIQMAGSGHKPNVIEQLDTDFTITDTGTGAVQLNVDGVEVMSATSAGIAITITGGAITETSLSVPSQLTADSSSIEAGTFSATSAAVPSQFTATSTGVALGTGTAISMAVPSGFSATTGGASVIDLTATQNVSGSTYASDSSVSDAELKYINTLSSNAQTQIAAKTVNASAAITGGTIAGLTSLAVPPGFTATTAGVEAISFTVTTISLPSVGFYDSDASAGDKNAEIYVNCTDTGDGTEDCDVFIQSQVSGTLTTHIQIDADLGILLKNDTLYVGSGSGMAFGGLGTYTNTAATAIPAQSTWYKYTGFTNILASNNMVGFTNADAKITATYAGVYEITGFCDLQAGNNDVTWLGVGIDGCSIVEQSSVADAHMAPTAVSIDISLNGLITLAAGEAAVLCIKNVSSSDDVTVEHATMILKQLGG